MNEAETAKPKRRWVKVLVWGLTGLLAVGAAAGAGGTWWLYGWRLGDAGVSECRDAELQQVLCGMDEYLCSEEMEAQVRQRVEELLPFYLLDGGVFEVLDGEWGGPTWGTRVRRAWRRRVEYPFLMHYLPLYAMKEAGQFRRELIRRAAEAGRADVANAEGYTLLMAALDMHRSEAVRYLLEHGCDPNQVFRQTEEPLTELTALSFTLLGRVSPAERIADMTLLCQHGADWEKCPQRDLLWHQVFLYINELQEKDPAQGEELLRAGLALGYRPGLYGKYGNSLLYSIGKMPHAVELAVELQGLGCLKTDLNAPVGDSLPLLSAVSSGNPDFVLWMLEQGADPNSRIPDEEEEDEDEWRNTPRTAVECVQRRLQRDSLSDEDMEKMLRIRELLLRHGGVLPPDAAPMK